MRCGTPETRSIATRKGGRPFRYPVPCGRCVACLATVRKAKCGQASAEAMSLLRDVGIGHLWMVTLTYRDGAMPLTEPRPVDLSSEILRPCLPRWVDALADRLGVGGPGHFTAREAAQRAMLRRRWHWTDREFEALKAGDYRPAPTLVYAELQKYFKRLRKAGLSFRYLVAGEYGDGKGQRKNGNPHWHVLFYGLDKDAVIEALRQWPFGNTHPDLNKRSGWRELARQVEQNGNPVKAGMYLTDYIVKGAAVPQNVGQAIREPEKVRYSEGLGFRHFREQLVPRMEALFSAPLPGRAAAFSAEQALVDFSTGEVLWPDAREAGRGLMVGRELFHHRVGRETYPLTYYLRHKLWEWSSLPTELGDLVSWLLSGEREQKHLETLGDPELRAEYEAELVKVREENERFKEARERRKEERQRERAIRGAEALAG